MTRILHLALLLLPTVLSQFDLNRCSKEEFVRILNSFFYSYLNVRCASFKIDAKEKETVAEWCTQKRDMIATGHLQLIAMFTL